MDMWRQRMVSYAQNREDVILDRVFRDQVQGFYVDVGANDPVVDSVTKHFYEKGWRGINVEPGAIFTKVEHDRPRDVNLNLAVSDHAGDAQFLEFPAGAGLSRLGTDTTTPAGSPAPVVRRVPVKPLREIFAEHRVGTIDFMSVDVEGHERQVLLGNDWQTYRPRVVVLEANEANSQEPTHQLWEDVLFQADYLYAYYDGLNRYYVRREDQHLLANFQTPPNIFDQFTTYQVVQLEAALHQTRQEVHGLGHALREQERMVLYYKDLLHGTGARTLTIGLVLARLLRRVGAWGRDSLARLG